MKPYAQQLQEEIDKVCPNRGLELTNMNDRATWKVIFTKESTKIQMAAANNVLKNFPLQDPYSFKLTVLDRLKQLDINISELKEEISKP